jgi:hypothetical protein
MGKPLGQHPRFEIRAGNGRFHVQGISKPQGRGAGKSTTPKASARLKNPSKKGSHIS